MKRQGALHMAEAPAVALTDVCFSYDGPLVLEDVTFAIPRGDFVSLIGPNGGGKTTLLKLMLGLVAPTRGGISVFGVPPVDARRLVGYVPQYQVFDAQFPVTVMDVTLMGRLGRANPLGPYRRAAKDAACEALRKVGLLELRDRPFPTLSGGQRQRALIARALAAAPELLLMDEPTANIDSLVVDELYGLLRTLNQAMTVVLVSHDLGFVSRLVRRVVCVNRTVKMHPTSELSGADMQSLYGTAVHMVRHDVHEGGGSCGCSTS